MVQPIALIFKINNGLIARSLDGLSDDEVWRQPEGTGNPIAWILGHLTETRGQILKQLKVPFDTGWPRCFARGSIRGGPENYPNRATIEAAWKETHHPMRDAFAALTEERLNGPHGGSPFSAANTLADHLAALAFHESYHVGQIGYVRKLLGHSAVAG